MLFLSIHDIINLVRKLIREAKIEEYVKLEQLFTPYFDKLKLSTINPFQKVYIYENLEIQGFICFSVIYEICELEYIAVLQPYQNQKIASKLLNYMIENNCNKQFTLEVNCKNKGAISLYEKKGFKIQKIRPKYYNGEDAYIMVLSR